MKSKQGGRSNNVVIFTWTEEEIRNFWNEKVLKTPLLILSNKKEIIPFDDCKIWTGALQNGYPAISQGHAKSKVKVHIMAVFLQINKFPKNNECISHLCHRKACINPEHLVIEALSLNNRRIGCLCAIQVPDMNITVKVCIHEPSCIRRDTDNIPENFKPATVK